MGIGIANCTGGNYPSSHNKMGVSPILVSFHLGWVSTSMIMGERVFPPPFSTSSFCWGKTKHPWGNIMGNGNIIFRYKGFPEMPESREVMSPSPRSPSDLSPWKHSSGAHWDACDANGTCCLHVACRSGTLSIVRVKSSVHWGLSF